MRILYGITKSNFGGAQRYVFDLATEAVKHGHEVAVLCGGRDSLVERLEAAGIRTILLPALARDVSVVGDLKSFLAIIDALKSYKPDVFHINSSKMGGMGTVAGRLTGVRRIIFTSHGWAFNESWRPWWQKKLIKFLHWTTVLFSHVTICVSSKTKRDISGLPFTDEKLRVVWNSVKPYELKLRDEARHTLYPEAGVDTLLVGAASELHKVKGLDVLLEAWEKFIPGRDAKLIVMGEGEERHNLQNMAKNLGISGTVIFPGFIENARAYLSGLDIFVMPSRSENLPYAILEAGIVGLPVIATRVGGIPEIIVNSINGTLIPPDDADVLLSSLILYAENPRMRDRLGKELEKTVEEKFTLEKMVRDTLGLYEH